MIRKFFKTYTRKCPDGTKHTLYRNIEDAFPLYITDNVGQLTAGLNIADSADANIGGNFASKVSGLLYDLDWSNRNIMFEFRSIYSVYQAEPCSNSEFFRTQIKQIVEDHKNLKLLEIKIKGLIDIININGTIDGQELLKIYMDIIKDFGRYLQTEAPKAKIYESRQIVKKWQKKGGR